MCLDQCLGIVEPHLGSGGEPDDIKRLACEWFLGLKLELKSMNEVLGRDIDTLSRNRRHDTRTKVQDGYGYGQRFFVKIDLSYL